MDDLQKQLKMISNENIIWYIYLFIVFFALFTNYLEREYFLTKDKRKKRYAQKINSTILIIAFFIYLYFFIIAFENSKNSKNKRISFERLVVSLLFLFAGALAIYADIDEKSNNIDLGIF